MPEASAPRFGSFILTFNRPTQLRETIRALIAQTVPPELVVVIDNGDNEETTSVIREFGDARLEYCATGENLGSAGGVAFGMRLLLDRGCEWIHSVDDDDPPLTPDTVERLRALIERNDDGRLGVVAAVGSRWDWTTGEQRRLRDDELTGDVPVDIVGGGQQLTVCRRVLEEIGTPDPEFFFGHYDPIWCLLVAKAGYRLMVDGELMYRNREIANRVGVTVHRAKLPRQPYDAIWRRYYVTRNYVYAMRQMFDRPDLARRETAKSLVRTVASWGHGPRYGARFSLLQLRGVVDGYRGRLGRTVIPWADPKQPSTPRR
ncbi:MAG: glycosyltransferase [Acidimicrobiia bacterium]